MPSADFRLPRVQGHAINVLISALLWLGIAAIARGWAAALHWSPPY